MKNKSIVFFLLFAIVLGAVVYSFRSSNTNDSLIIQKNPTKNNNKKSKKPKLFKDIVDHSQKKNDSKPHHLIKGVTNPFQKNLDTCETSLTKDFANIDFQDDVLQTCLHFIDEQFGKSSLSSMLQYCRNSQDKNEVCDMIPVFVKIMTTALDSNYENVDVQDLDEIVLASRIIWSIVGYGSPIPLKNLDNVVLYSDEMIRRDPDIYDAYKAKALALFLKEYMHKDKTVAEDIENVFDEIDLFDHNDSQINEMIMVRYLLDKDIDSAEEVALSLLKDDPENYVGAYFMAAVEWRDGQREKARDWLNKALDLSPENVRVLDSLKKIDDAELEDSIFTFNLNVKFEGLND